MNTISPISFKSKKINKTIKTANIQKQIKINQNTFISDHNVPNKEGNFILVEEFMKLYNITKRYLANFVSQNLLILINNDYINLSDPINKKFVDNYQEGKLHIDCNESQEQSLTQVLSNEKNTEHINPNLISLEELSKRANLDVANIKDYADKLIIIRDDNEFIDLSNKNFLNIFNKIVNNNNSNYYYMSLNNIDNELKLFKDNLKNMFSYEILYNAKQIKEFSENEFNDYIDYYIKSNFETSKLDKNEIIKFKFILKDAIIEEVSHTDSFNDKNILKFDNKYELLPYKRLFKGLIIKEKIDTLNEELKNNTVLYNKITAILNNLVNNETNLLLLDNFIDNIYDTLNNNEEQDLSIKCQKIIDDYANNAELTNNLSPRIKKYQQIYKDLPKQHQKTLNTIVMNKQIIELSENCYPDKIAIDVLNTVYSPFKKENDTQIRNVLALLKKDISTKIYPMIFLYEKTIDKELFWKELAKQDNSDKLDAQLKIVSQWLQSKQKNISLEDCFKLIKENQDSVERVFSTENNIFEILNVSDFQGYKLKLNSIPQKNINYIYKLFGLNKENNIDDLANIIKENGILSFNIKPNKIIQNGFFDTKLTKLNMPNLLDNKKNERKYFRFSINFDENKLDLQTKIKFLGDFHIHLNNCRMLLYSRNTHPTIRSNDFLNEVVYRTLKTGTNDYYFILRLLGLHPDDIFAEKSNDIFKVSESISEKFTNEQIKTLNNILEIINCKELIDISPEREFRIRFLENVILKKSLNINNLDEMKSIINNFKNQMNKSLSNGFVNVKPIQFRNNGVIPVIEFYYEDKIYNLTINNLGYAHDIYTKSYIKR